MGWNNDDITTFGTFALFAGVNLRDADFLVTAFTTECDFVCVRRYDFNTAALWAFDSLARMFILNVKLLATVFARKLNHR